MKIAVVASNLLSLPVKNEQIREGWTRSLFDLTYEITEGMVKKGHDVTLYASGDTKTSARLVSLWDKPSVELEKEKHQWQFDGWYLNYDFLLQARCLEDNKTEKYDLIYSLHSFNSGYFGNLIDTPIVSTIHGNGSEHEENVLTKIIKPNKYVGISRKQIQTMPYFKFAECIYHGIDADVFKLNLQIGSDNLVFVGRLSTDKGIDLAAKVSKNLNKNFKILGSTHYQGLIDEIKSYGDNIELLGHKSREEVNNIVSNSKLFLFPIRWDEPFGLVLIESLACGTPIVAFDNGSLPEIVEDGKTGFLVSMDENHSNGDWIIKKTGVEGIEEAINKIYSMDAQEYEQMRKNCRESFENKFTKEIMIDNYEKLFEKIIKE